MALDGEGEDDAQPAEGQAAGAVATATVETAVYVLHPNCAIEEF